MMAFTNKLAPSILNADFASLGAQIAEIEAGGADWVHLDVMDGHFVPNISIGPVVVEAIGRFCKLPLDCHLMISDPEKYVAEFAKAGAGSITVHQEATVHLDSLVHTVKSLVNKDGGRIRVGASLNPATPIETLEHVLPELDLVLIMSVNPGFGGQKFIPYTLEKVRKLRAKIDALGKPIDIQVDGGVGLQNVKSVIDAGATVIVAGTAIFRSGNIPDTCRKMKALIG
jgi:ribulose-phosphate 3-epimerase